MMSAIKPSCRLKVWSATAAWSLSLSLGFGSTAGADDTPTAPGAAPTQATAAGAPAAGATAGAPAAPGNPPKAQGRSTAQQEAGEPRADTSQPVSVSPGGAPADAPKSGAAPTERAAPARDHGVAGQNPVGRVSPGRDSLNLGTATVTGEHEQPKVMYIVPWKRSDIGDLSGKPMNSLLDEALAPVDRDEFRREVVYFDALEGDATQGDASQRASAAAQGEK